MNKLVISLTGNITDTNFEEWKKDLLVQIEGIQKELKSDGDFALATDQAKSLKQAETALKQAKESAIEQASEIQRLFGALDEVSAAARKARLFLEGQIKARKQEIKDEIVLSGIRKVRSLIDEQNDDFRLLDLREFTDRGMFEEAIKGKRGIEGMDAAVGLLVDRLRAEITGRAGAVDERARKLAAIDPLHLPLFQDRAALLGLSDEELDATIAERIEVFKQQQAALAAASVAEAEAASTEETKGAAAADDDAENGDLFGGAELAGGAERAGDEGAQSQLQYRISLQVLATAEQAENLVAEIRKNYADKEIVQSVALEKVAGND